MLPILPRSLSPRKQAKTNIIHRNSTISSNPDVFQLISRDATYTPSQSIPAQAGKNKHNTSELNNFFQSRCISINFPRCYLLSLVAYPRASRQNKQNTSESDNLWQSRCIPINFPRIYLLAFVVYSRASQPQFNFPRIYLHPLVAYSRASRQKNNSYTNFTLSAPKRALRASASALPLTVILRGSSFLSLPSTM